MEQRYQCVRGEGVEVIVSVDSEHLPGLVAVVSSVLRHSSLPVRFHVVVAGEKGGRREVEGWLHCHGMDRNVQVSDVNHNASLLLIINMNGKQRINHCLTTACLLSMPKTRFVILGSSH